MESKRIVYLDCLRVIATVAVVVLHVSASNWSAFGGRSFEWNVFNFYDSIVRWGVPIFLMISGSLFLHKEIDIKNIFSKNIFRLIVAYIFWAFFYAIWIPALKCMLYGKFEISFGQFIQTVISGHYHMWFIPMIIGIYMCIPIIKQITKTTMTTKYYLILSFVFAFLNPQLVNLSRDFIGGKFYSLIISINSVISNMNMNIVLGYSFYFVLGYYLSNLELTENLKTSIYIMGLLGFLCTILLNAAVAWKTQEPCQTYYDNFTVNVLLEALVVFIWFRSRSYSNSEINTIISKLSRYSLGVYFIHPFILDLLKAIGLRTVQFSPVLSVPAISIIAILISYILSCAIHRIPIINNWIV